MIAMYGHLLAQYKINSTVVNHRIIAMFLRLMRLEIALPEIADSDTPINPLGTKRVTLEPMLYNLQLIMVMEQILNDTIIKTDRSFESLLSFSTNLMYKFWQAADLNPMLYVECLFRHTTPHRFCESVTNMYVSDELRMMAEREILREHYLLEQAEYDEGGIKTRPSRGRHGEDDDYDDEELEFTGDNVRAGTDTTNDPLETSAEKENGQESDDEDDEIDQNQEEESIDLQQSTTESKDYRDKEEDDEKSDVDGQKRPREDESSIQDHLTANIQEDRPAKAPRTDPTVDEESSDDESEFHKKPNSTTTSQSKPKFAIEDDSDDDD
jgi:hypothetical protein